MAWNGTNGLCGNDATPLGLGIEGTQFGISPPRVAALPQPWASRQNPVGIPGTAKQFAGVVRTAMPEHLAEQTEEMLKNPYNLEFGGAGRRLPQRGCVRQPGVAAWPLPRGAITHGINPNGVVSGDGGLYAAPGKREKRS